jgi:hypothetical protein
MDYDDQLRLFKQDCATKDSDIVVQKYLIDGASYFFDAHYDSHEEFDFKKSLASSLGAHIRDIAIVGSGKLGFSLKPEREIPGLYQFNKFDKRYEIDPDSKKSDLDVAIVSRDLFDSQLEELYRFTSAYSNTEFNAARLKSFSKYILKGWIRPDFLPASYSITEKLGVTSQHFSTKYQRSVNIGIYKSWYYFEQYHVSNVHTLSLNLIVK